MATENKKTIGFWGAFSSISSMHAYADRWGHHRARDVHVGVLRLSPNKRGNAPGRQPEAPFHGVVLSPAGSPRRSTWCGHLLKLACLPPWCAQGSR